MHYKPSRLDCEWQRGFYWGGLAASIVVNTLWFVLTCL